MSDRFKNILRSVLCLSLLFFGGCVSLETHGELGLKKYQKPTGQGVYHKVKRGETLWRIAKTYHVTVSEVAQMNNIPKAAQIERGQLIFIPGASAVKEIVLEESNGKNDFVWPLEGKVIKFFHERYGTRINKGIDIKGNVGDQIKAARTGYVVFADFLSGYGNTIILDHSDGFYSVYAKNSKLLVRLGERVLKNSAIAQVGHNNKLAYLHFEIRRKSVEDNPLYYLP